LRTKYIKECFYFTYFMEMSIIDFRNEDKLYEEEAGMSALLPHMKASLTRLEKMLDPLIESIVDANMRRQLPVGPQSSVSGKIVKMLERINNVMMTDNYLNGSEETIDLDSVKIGLPEHMVYLITRILTGTDLFMEKYHSVLDKPVLKEFTRVKKYSDTLKKQLLNANIIWFESNDKKFEIKKRKLLKKFSK